MEKMEEMDMERSGRCSTRQWTLERDDRLRLDLLSRSSSLCIRFEGWGTESVSGKTSLVSLVDLMEFLNDPSRVFAIVDPYLHSSERISWNRDGGIASRLKNFESLAHVARNLHVDESLVPTASDLNQLVSRIRTVKESKSVPVDSKADIDVEFTQQLSRSQLLLAEKALSFLERVALECEKRTQTTVLNEVEKSPSSIMNSRKDQVKQVHVDLRSANDPTSAFSTNPSPSLSPRTRKPIVHFEMAEESPLREPVNSSFSFSEDQKIQSPRRNNDLSTLNYKEREIRSPRLRSVSPQARGLTSTLSQKTSAFDEFNSFDPQYPVREIRPSQWGETAGDVERQKKILELAEDLRKQRQQLESVRNVLRGSTSPKNSKMSELASMEAESSSSLHSVATASSTNYSYRVPNPPQLRIPDHRFRPRSKPLSSSGSLDHLCSILRRIDTDVVHGTNDIEYLRSALLVIFDAASPLLRECSPVVGSSITDRPPSLPIASSMSGNPVFTTAEDNSVDEKGAMQRDSSPGPRFQRSLHSSEKVAEYPSKNSVSLDRHLESHWSTSHPMQATSVGISTSSRGGLPPTFTRSPREQRKNLMDETSLLEPMASWKHLSS